MTKLATRLKLGGKGHATYSAILARHRMLSDFPKRSMA